MVRSFVFLLLVLFSDVTAAAHLELSEEPIPLRKDLPELPRPPIEIGDSFLGNTPVRPGFRLPTGAMIQPAFTLFGTFRTAVQSFETATSGIKFSEWANRLDLFGNLQLSGTERLLIGFRPLDRRARFSGYQFSPSSTEGSVDAFNAYVTTLFFEGEIAEIFPCFDPEDHHWLDIGFSVGRQRFALQEGMLLDDTIDSIGIVRNTILPSWGSNLRVTFLYGWNQIHRDDNLLDPDACLFGLTSELDVSSSTVAADLLYVDSSGASGIFWGFSAVQRICLWNTSFRLLGSHALDGASSKVDNGYLFFGELSKTPPNGHNFIYCSGFWGIETFTSAARDPAVGGPLGRVGTLFSAVGLGRYAAPLINRPSHAYGGAVGYQFFFDHGRHQLLIEGGGRRSTRRPTMGQLAVAAQYQRAMSQHIVWIASGFAATQEAARATYGGRTEILVKF